MQNGKDAGSRPAFRFITAVLVIFTASGLLLHASAPGKLLEIRFPASFTAFTGFTPEETLRLWEEMQQPQRRYTRCSLNADGSISLFVTRAQQEENLQVYREGLAGWTALCAMKGVTVTTAADHRQLTCLADSAAAWSAASGDIRSVLASLSCLQIAENASPHASYASSVPWSVRVDVYIRTDPAHLFLTYSIPE